MTTPKFFIGTSPSMASQIITTAEGVMVSMTTLRKRKSMFKVDKWILDSGAFTEIARNGSFANTPEEYIAQIHKWSSCGNLLTAVTQDYMCEAFVLNRTGMTVPQHQELTVARYNQLIAIAKSTGLQTPIMPVLQGYSISDYIECLKMYGEAIPHGQWVGVGSVCKRNGDPAQVADILRAIKLTRPDLKLHGFGLKQTALTHPTTRALLHSYDSMAWSYPKRMKKLTTPLVELAHNYQKTMVAITSNTHTPKVARTAGAGNNQGRKPTWNAGPTIPIRIPATLANEIIRFARELDGRYPIMHGITESYPTQNKELPQ